MTWIFLSPHFDDAAYSCGGLIWELGRRGEPVEVWTVCSGEPPDASLTPFARELHARWGTDGAQVIATRKREDQAACRRLGAAVHYFGVPDCIYRWLPGPTPLVAKEEDLWQPVSPGEDELIGRLVRSFADALPHSTTLVLPLGLGNHVDHRLTRRAGEAAARMTADICLAYYADFPYVLRQAVHPVEHEPGWKAERYPLSAEGLAAWQDAIAAYASQLSSFWPGAAEMREQVSEYVRENGGARLYFFGLTRGPCGVSSIS
jgi:LmbE family N-acetylglucosaminyl deacetylase